MKILVVGSGGREHALCWSLASSPLVTQIYCAPGNGGIGEIAECIPIDSDDIKNLLIFSKKMCIDFVIVGPEGPLVAGLVDKLEEIGIKTFGPKANAARLEASKIFTKELCLRANVPTAQYEKFTSIDDAKEFVRKIGTQVVVKADGLAAGKGVVVCQDIAEADVAIEQILKGKFGLAGKEIIVEECLNGEEISVFALVNGSNVTWLESAQDHKRLSDGDTGPNTGGMGAYSPSPIITPDLKSKIIKKILMPTAIQMENEGNPYTGVLFAGLMIVDDDPYLLEYNVRFGDPECQVILPRLQSDLLSLLIATRDGNLNQVNALFTEEVALTIVLANKGYPGHFDKGSIIKGISKVNSLQETILFHAGTKLEGDNLLAVGGRVLNITGLGRDIIKAKDNAYKAIKLIDWKNSYYRNDIGWRAITNRMK